MYGWNGKLLQIDLTKGKAVPQKYDAEFAQTFLGGRGFAAKILWDQLKPGLDPLSPENLLIFAAGIVLLTPGLITDAAGLLLLIPETRFQFKRYLKLKFNRWFEQRDYRIDRFP